MYLTIWRYFCAARKAAFFSELDKNIILIMIHVLRTRWCKRQTIKKEEKSGVFKHKTDYLINK